MPEQPTIDRVAYVATSAPLGSTEAASALGASAPGTTDGFAVGVFTVAAALGIIAIIKFRFGNRQTDQESTGDDEEIAGDERDQP